jgi:hypothetical protein
LMNGFENDKIIRTMTSGQESTNYHTIGRYWIEIKSKKMYVEAGMNDYIAKHY